MEPLKVYIGNVDYDTQIYAIVTAIIVVLLTIVIFLFLRRKRVSRRNILITGLSDAGKTLLFSKLVSARKVVTYTSMKENIAVYKVDKKRAVPVTLVDIPGNERLREKYLDEFLMTTKGIIFVIDSLNFPKEIRDVAEFLFTILQEPLVHAYKMPFLIACNKQDHAVSKGAKVIQSQLEKEINTLRVTQTGRLASTSAGSSGKIFLGHRGRDFTFADLKTIRVDFTQCSALEDGKIAADIVSAWIAKVA